MPFKSSKQRKKVFANLPKRPESRYEPEIQHRVVKTETRTVAKARTREGAQLKATRLTERTGNVHKVVSEKTGRKKRVFGKI